MPRSQAPAERGKRDTVRRRHRVEELLGKRPLHQEDLVTALRREGFAVTQATVSRDLSGLGAVRTRDGFVLPETNGPPSGFGQRVFAELVLSVVSSGNLVVVRTYPGMAPTVGAVLDRTDIAGVIGTVAGDDTVLVVADEKTGGRKLAKAIEGLR